MVLERSNGLNDLDWSGQLVRESTRCVEATGPRVCTARWRLIYVPLVGPRPKDTQHPVGGKAIAGVLAEPTAGVQVMADYGQVVAVRPPSSFYLMYRVEE
jgi:hypothetical protein